MESVAKLGMQGILSPHRAPISVLSSVRAPVECATNDVVSSTTIGIVVAAGLDNIYLAAGGPRAVGICHGHHPYCRPQPITFGYLGFDLDAPVFDTGTKFGIDAARLDWLDDGAVGSVCGCYAVEVNIRGRCTSTGSRKIDSVVLSHKLLVLQSRLDV